MTCQEQAGDEQERTTDTSSQHEQFCRFLIENIQDYAVFGLGPDGLVTSWNQGAAALLGYQAGEVVGTNFARFFTEDAIEAGQPERDLRLAVELGRTESDHWAVRKDGSQFWASGLTTALRDERGQLLGFARILHDLTERRLAAEERRRLRAREQAALARAEAEEALRRSEERFALLVKSVVDYAIYLLDPDGHITSWNEGAERIYGYREDDVLGRSYSIFFTPEESARDTPHEGLRLAAAQGRHESEGWRVRKDGSRFWSNAVLTALHDPTGQLVGFAKVTRDLTERMRAQEEQAQLVREQAARVAAEQAQQRVVSIIENAPIGLLYIEAESGQVFANQVAVKLIGHPIAEDAGLQSLVPSVVHPDGYPLTVEELPAAHALRGETIEGQELVIVQPDGQRLPALVSAAPLRGAGERVTGAIVALRDISAIKDLERLREEWISVISHDLRQPVTIITGYLGVLQRLVKQSGNPSAAERALIHARTAAANLNRMIHDLLDASRIEARRLTLLRQPVELPTLVRDVVERMNGVLESHPVQVKVLGQVPKVGADPGRIEQVLTNLLSNAARYGDPETPILVEVKSNDRAAQVSVVNRGPGIAPADLPRLFNRFYRAGKTSASGQSGLGLGLYISKGIITAHGGTIWAESVPGEITIFTFTLPAMEPGAER